MNLRLVLLLLVLVAQNVIAQPLRPQYWETTNGARVAFYQTMDIPMLDIRVAFAAGSAYDGALFGLSALTTQLLNQGNAGLDTTAIAEKLAQTGAQYGSETHRDMTTLHLRTLTQPESLIPAVETFALILNRPDFPASAFVREKAQQLIAIAQAQDSPDQMANQAFFKGLYQNHPYGHPIKGDSASVNQIELSHVNQFYREFFVSRNAHIVLVGAIDQKHARALAEQLTTTLPQGKAAIRPPKAHTLSEELNIEVKFPSAQSALRLGQLGVAHHDPHYFPLLVGNYTLGGGSGLVSQLALELREKRGLTYGVYSQFIPMPGLGPFLISMSTQRDQASTALALVRGTLSAFVHNGPSAQELTEAKQYLTGSFPLSLASNSSIAETLLNMLFYQLPPDYLEQYVTQVNRVQLKDIKQAFRELVTPDKLVQVTVGVS